MNGTLSEMRGTSAVPTFGLVEERRTDWRHWSEVAGGSLFAHVLLIIGVVAVLRLPAPPPIQADLNISPGQRDVTKLIAPPSQMTQRSENKGQLSKEFNLSSLMPRPAQPSVPASPGAAALPRQKLTLPNAKPRPLPSSSMSEAPALDLRASTTPPPPPLGMEVPAPPPQIEPQEKPKLAFERPGSNMGTTGPAGLGRVTVPKPAGNIDEAVRRMTRSGGRGLVVGDEDAGAPAISPGAPAVPVPGKLGSAVELLSDPMGVDFWPYLVKVLSTVRRNWFAVIPESARLGRQGRTVIQFAINRDGSVPKLVIATPSGTDALDRASVAGISASNPFPPLPAEFKGGQIRLQFVFKYNVR